MSIPRHVQVRLIAEGVMTPQRVTTTARPRRCPTCSARTLAAISDLGFETWVDPDPLTPLGELQALAAGRHTFEASGGGLDWRGEHAISSRPANVIPVHAQHQCRKEPTFDTAKKAPGAFTIPDKATIPF